MRNNFLLFIALLALNSCGDKLLQTYTANVPIYMSYDELRSSFQVTAREELEKTGKDLLQGSSICTSMNTRKAFMW